jgi:chromosomal replication initiation ATPase DnaA
MHIYISGKVTGLPFPEVKAKFQDMQDFLEDLGLEVVNPINNGLTKDESWEQHIVRDIAMLLPCEAVCMLDNWTDSVGAGIEYDIAMRTGKDIWFESRCFKNQREVLRIQNAVHETTGMKLSEYAAKSRKRNAFFARLLFVYHCWQERIGLESIARHVHRDHSSVLYLLKKYGDEAKYNPVFRELAQKTDSILKK